MVDVLAYHLVFHLDHVRPVDSDLCSTHLLDLRMEFLKGVYFALHWEKKMVN